SLPFQMTVTSFKSCSAHLPSAWRKRAGNWGAATFACLFLTVPWRLFSQNPPPEEPKILPVKTSITVIEKLSTDAPPLITALDNATLNSIPGVNLDDRLRAVPGFTLFRRTSSLVANPTTQGVSLRGIGSSGASRTLVLWDGIPENDPFGG